jgi:LemA protein
VFWALMALTVFWALGAYNRLVRLRADMVRALQTLVAQWQLNAQRIRDELSSLSHTNESDSAWASLGDATQSWRPLALATKQLQACLTGVQTKPNMMPPLDDLASVRAAHELLHSAWQRLVTSQDDLAGAAVPQSLAQLWQQQNLLAQEKHNSYNHCVQRFNGAIEQFPAIFLAWIFGFSAAPYL